MKTSLSLLFLIFVLFISASAQVFERPFVSTVGDRLCYITKVELTPRYTIVSLEHLNNNNGWIRLDPKINIKVGEKRFRYLKSENIALSPAQYKFEPEEARHPFKIYFEPLPKNVRVFDMLEVEPGTRYDFNFFGVDLNKKRKSDTQISHYITDSDSESAVDEASTVSLPLNSSFANVGGMFRDVLKSSMDAYLDYLKKPETLKEMAKINRQFYSYLIQEGFTEAEALKILIATPLSPLNVGSK